MSSSSPNATALSSLLSVAAPAPPLLQIANLFFFLAALFSDLLLIRLSLALAFIALTASFAATSALSGAVILDGLLWSICTGIWHWRALYSLVKEEVRAAVLVCGAVWCCSGAGRWCMRCAVCGVQGGVQGGGPCGVWCAVLCAV